MHFCHHLALLRERGWLSFVLFHHLDRRVRLVEHFPDLTKRTLSDFADELVVLRERACDGRGSAVAVVIIRLFHGDSILENGLFYSF
jgi:hypothetical protein